MRQVAAVLVFLWLGLFPSSFDAAERPKIALVFEGGGALGFAHIGVLQWFEDHHIPVDAIAGTSMGGLIGGLYAAGITPSDIQKLVGGIDWRLFLATQQPYSELGFRRREDRLAFPNELSFGWRGGLAIPSGLDSGQVLDSLLDSALLPYFNMKSFDDLPIPFRCVATDLASGEEKDFDRGSLAFALRATGLIPALFIPEKRGSAVYTDGGSLNNLPVNLAKQMNADIVIAVYLDEGPPAADFDQSLVGIAGRTASIMIAANERRNLRLADILLSADLQGFGTSDFSKFAAIIPRGTAAAQEKQALLARLEVSDAEWKTYVDTRNARKRRTPPVPEYVTVRGGTEDQNRFIQKALSGDIGKPVDPASLEKRLLALKAEGTFETMRYGLLEEDGKTGLGISVVPKSNQPPFLNFGLTIDGSDPNDVRFGLATRFTLVNLGGFRSEWRTDASLGELYAVKSEYYHPLTGTSKWFVAAHAGAEKTRFDIYDNRDRTAEYSVHRETAGLDFGYAVSRDAELRVGEGLVARNIDLKLGSPYTPNYSRASGDTSVLFRYYGQDDAAIPHQGLNSETRLDLFSTSPFGGAYHAAQTKESFFLPVSEPGSVWFTAEAGSAFGAKDLGLDSFTLGGPFRLGAYGIHELIGNQYFLFQGGYSHQIVTFNPLFGGAIYGLAWFEVGKVYGDPQANSLPMDGSLALAAKTGIGPIFVGMSAASTSRVKWWFGLGRVF